MTRSWLIVLALSLVLAVSMAARRKPEQLACAADTYARAVTTVKNLARRGRGQAPISCAPSAWACRPVVRLMTNDGEDRSRPFPSKCGESPTNILLVKLRIDNVDFSQGG